MSWTRISPFDPIRPHQIFVTRHGSSDCTDPVLDLTMPYWIIDSVPCAISPYMSYRSFAQNVPGPPAAVKASSPMKKSKSSVPRLFERLLPGPAPPVRNDGLFATAGRPDPDPPAPPPVPFVAMAVGKTKDGESLPAKPWERISAEALSRSWYYSPSLEYPVPLSDQQALAL